MVASPDVVDGVKHVRPQPAQERFLSTPADIAIYGGAAGGGKSFALLIEPVRHYHRPGFYGVVFRRQATQITNEGGLWDEASPMYAGLGAIGVRHRLSFKFPSGARVRFAHLENEKDKYAWMGSQLAFIGFDELTHFSESQFWYLLSRNRSTCGVRPYVRATCNPDPDSFVARLVAWWIDADTGLAIPSRAGVVRWFARSGNDLVWGDTREDVIRTVGGDCEPKSFTFIPARVTDNQELLRADPHYLANLKALPHVDRERLMNGNWKVRPSAGSYFRRSMFQIVDAAPVDVQSRIRYWDRAATEPSPSNPDPDWTAGVKMSKGRNGVLYVEHVERFRRPASEVFEAIRAVAEQDGRAVDVGIEHDPGQAGKVEASFYVRNLMGFKVHTPTVQKDKETRAKPVSTQAGAGNIRLVRGPWNEAFLDELEGFPVAAHDDQVDGLSGAFNWLTDYRPLFLS